MTLGELIKALEAADPDLVVPRGFGNPHSYRGYYHELAFEPRENVTVRQMLEAARSALGATYEGWKGGDFTMGEYTDVHLAVEGCTGEDIGPVLLRYMLATPPASLPAVKPVVIVFDPRECTTDYIDEIAKAVRDQSGGKVIVTEVDAQMSDVMLAVADHEVSYEEAVKIWRGQDDDDE